ncbi:hypothetical protein P9250_13665 [Caballeronia sp. LP006]|jgi:hypothetical protein|uniref:hypothetical protein n=1 Tax=unclassified Caballeronia TaxID=2646786 RepID=UPI001FD37916|nr:MULTISPECIES: hypothetical protein [unclassified Caballeronia]MDR5775281.1 hypothetical protein [Caballeronia sp. LZ002]MDR5800726.1 hypothetical protein [Caballeronia sp. LZ001]MDR5828930.1 hypothetical protein [Caballeronia sp. LP006]MDR5850719.1 hypothetical protein [Caballeronia sp. LZ003]
MDMTLAQFAGHHGGACQRLRIMARARMANDDASCERIRQLFHSPLGVYVSQAQREGCALRLEFDVASEDLAFTLRTLRRVMPEARVEGVGPRVFAHRVISREAH